MTTSPSSLGPSSTCKIHTNINRRVDVGVAEHTNRIDDLTLPAHQVPVAMAIPGTVRERYEIFDGVTVPSWYHHLKEYIVIVAPASTGD